MTFAPLFPTVTRLCQEHYPTAKAIFWAGSLAQGQGTERSDLDIVVVFEHIPNAYREAFAYEGWKVDAFIHDRDTLRYFFEDSRRNSAISGTVQMVLTGKEIMPQSDFSRTIRSLAQHTLDLGPLPWNKEQFDKERFLITDVLDDILCPANRAEQLASLAWLYEALAQFYFRAAGKWRASGKSIVRYLENDNKSLAHAFTEAFEAAFSAQDTHKLERLVNDILHPYGGLLWEGFRSDAPKESRETFD